MELEKNDLSLQLESLAAALREREAKVFELEYEVELQKERASRLEDRVVEIAESSDREKAFLSSRTSDLTHCVSAMRLGIVEAQGELATQSMVNGSTALNATRENERIAERLDTLVQEYELLWTHSQQQVRMSFVCVCVCVCVCVYLFPNLFVLSSRTPISLFRNSTHLRALIYTYTPTSVS